MNEKTLLIGGLSIVAFLVIYLMMVVILFSQANNENDDDNTSTTYNRIVNYFYKTNTKQSNTVNNIFEKTSVILNNVRGS